MIPADIDPTLCAAEPSPDRLDDGFSPPPQEDAAPEAQRAAATQERVLGPKSPF